MVNTFLEADLDAEAEKIKGILDVLRYAIVAAGVNQVEEELDFRSAIASSIEARTVATFILFHLPSNANPHNIDRFMAMADTAGSYTRKFWRKFSLKQVSDGTIGTSIQAAPALTSGFSIKPPASVTPKVGANATFPGKRGTGSRPNFKPTNRKFTEDQVREIRTHFAQFKGSIPFGEYSVVAKAYGGSPADIRGIALRKTYVNVK